MDYGISSGISCFGKDYSRATCSLPPCKYDSVSSVPPNSLLFSGSHFAPQRTASCQDVWGCHVNTQLCMLTPCASRVEVCTVKRGNCTVGWMYGVSSGNHESPFRSPRCFRGKKLITAAAFMFTLFLRKEWMISVKSWFYLTLSWKIEAVEAHSFHVTSASCGAVHPKNLLQNNKQRMCYTCCKWLVFGPCCLAT